MCPQGRVRLQTEQEEIGASKDAEDTGDFAKDGPSHPGFLKLSGY